MSSLLECQKDEVPKSLKSKETWDTADSPCFLISPFDPQMLVVHTGGSLADSGAASGSHHCVLQVGINGLKGKFETRNHRFTSENTAGCPILGLDGGIVFVEKQFWGWPPRNDWGIKTY